MNKPEFWMTWLYEPVEKWMTWFYETVEKWIKPVTAAVRSKDINAIIALKESGANFSVKSYDGQNLLHLLAKENCETEGLDEEIFDLLISEHCFDLNAVDVDGKSALHVASTYNNQSVARKLIEHGTDVNCKDNMKLSPLHYAVIADKFEMVELLLSKRANIEAKSQSGLRPIHLVKSENVLYLLLRDKAYIDAKNNYGDTALFRSIIRGNSCCVKKLLIHGADFNNDLKVINMINNFHKYMKDYPVLFTVLQFSYMMIIIGLPCPNVSLRFITMMQRSADRFENKILSLKCTHIDDRTTFYDFLHMDPNQRCKLYHACKEKLEKSTEFNPFSQIVEAYCNRALNRRHWLKLAKKAWVDLTNIFLPEPCIDGIIKHLTDVELIKIIESEVD